MAAEEIICGICGASNDVEAERCRSCGARIIQFSQELSEEELYARRHQQDTFEWRWVAISFALLLGLAALAIVLLPLVISAYDPQGFAGIMIVIALWFAGSAIVAFMSPDKTFLEPPVGGMIAVVPTMMYLSAIADVYQLSMVAYLTGASMAVMMALMGAFVGERIKGDGSRAERSRTSAKPASSG